MGIRGKVLLSCLLAMTLGLTGCGASGTEPAGTTAAPSSNGAETESGKKELTERSASSDILIAVESDLVTLDPHDATNTLDGSVQRMIMDGFFGFDAEMNVVNLLATEYQANEDATEFILTLREGVSFTDGTPWNAEAAKINLDRMADQSLGLKRNGLFAMIDTSEAVDEYTIKINLKYSFGAFINTLAHPAGAMISPSVIAAGNCSSSPVGTGQYKFVEWRPGEYWKIELNEDWWGYNPDLNNGKAFVDAAAGFSSVTFKPVPESATRVAMIQSAEADMIYPIPTESYSVLEADPNVNVTQDESIIMFYVYLNTEKGALTDTKVRQALNYAISKDAFCAVVHNGLATNAGSYMSPAVQFYVEQEPYEYNPEKARELLAEAGYGNGLTLKAYTTNATAYVKFAEFIQQQLEQVGVTVEISALETGTFSEQIDSNTGGGSNAEYDMALRGWSPSTGDADWVLRAIFSYELVPPMGTAYSYFRNDAFEQAIQDGLNSADPDVRAEAYERAQKILWEECPAVPMGNKMNTFATSSRVNNIGLIKDGALYLREGYFLGK